MEQFNLLNIGTLSMQKAGNKKKKRGFNDAFCDSHEVNKKNLLKEMRQSLKELKLIEQGQLKSRPAKYLLNEL